MSVAMGPTWKGACPTCGGDVTRVEMTANRRYAQMVGKKRHVYHCENDNSRRLTPHIPTDWQPPTE